jgi:hypothetical protein
MSNNSGKWIPLSLDNSLHRCFASNGGKTKKDPIVVVNQQQPKLLTLEDLNLRVKLLESIILDPRRK